MRRHRPRVQPAEGLARCTRCRAVHRPLPVRRVWRAGAAQRRDPGIRAAVLAAHRWWGRPPHGQVRGQWRGPGVALLEGLLPWGGRVEL
eukprot:7385113-Prymnesium_polylepis.4